MEPSWNLHGGATYKHGGDQNRDQNDTGCSPQSSHPAAGKEKNLISRAIIGAGFLVFPRAQHFTDITSFNPPRNLEKEDYYGLCTHEETEAGDRGCLGPQDRQLVGGGGREAQQKRWACARLSPQGQRGREENRAQGRKARLRRPGDRSPGRGMS